jgi:hypothetical protein
MNPVVRIRGAERFENVNGAVRDSFRKTNGKMFAVRIALKLITVNLEEI